MIDSYETVVRLKRGLTQDQPPEHFGTRTDVICARSHLFDTSLPFWHFSGDIEERARRIYGKYGQAKISTGLGAVFCALERGFTEVALIGYDQLMYGKAGKYNDKARTGFTAHDGKAEMECLKALPVKVIDLVREHEQIRRF